MREKAAIPRLAQRAEGPPKRSGSTQTTYTIFATPIYVDRASGLAS
jgi:hypothetical protein